MSSPITYVDYTATAAQTDFAFSFPYLEDEHVIVEIDGSATTDFTIVTTPSTKVVLDSGATAGQVVRVSRSIQPDQNLVDFVNGSVLTESELDRAYLHNRYLAEESAEQNDVSLRIKQGDTNWDALNKRIKNVGDPVEEQDAATKNYVDGVIGDVAVGTLPDDSVTYAKLQDAVGNNVLLGNDNGAGEEIQELNAAEVRTVLNVADGATANTGTVTSVGSGTGLTGGPITGSGTLSIDNGGVDTLQLADNAVTTAKITDSNVTAAKVNFPTTIAHARFFGNVGTGTLQEEIAANTVTWVYGFSAIVSTATTGVYTLTFSTARASGDSYTVVLGREFTSPSTDFLVVKNRTANGFDLHCTHTTSLSSVGLNVAVIG